MKAIVLTCDRYRLSAGHMIRAYERLWPDHPFRFRVPFQELAPAWPESRVESRRTPAAIQPTMRALLADLADDEWVYWAMDDKYPLRLDLGAIGRLLAWLGTPAAAAADAVLFCRCMWMWDPQRLTGERLAGPAGETLLERRAWEQTWIHQFARVRALRELFALFPEEIPDLRIMDETKRRKPKPPGLRLWVTRRNHAAFGESTSRGRLTRNCAASLRAQGFEVPPALAPTAAARRHHVHGTAWDNLRYRLHIRANRVRGWLAR